MCIFICCQAKIILIYYEYLSNINSTSMLIDNQLLYIIIFFLMVNLIAFLIMLMDKIKSTNPGARRISEGTLFFLATAFGSFGVYIGMFAFRHKTQKWYFLIGIPFLMIQNTALAYLIFLYFATR